MYYGLDRGFPGGLRCHLLNLKTGIECSQSRRFCPGDKCELLFLGLLSYALRTQCTLEGNE